MMPKIPEKATYFLLKGLYCGMECSEVEYEIGFNGTIAERISLTRMFPKMDLELGPFSRHSNFSIGYVECSNLSEARMDDLYGNWKDGSGLSLADPEV